MKSPLVSIITPAYKSEKTIVRAALSVVRQDFSDWEMIIISDDYLNYHQVLMNHQIDDERFIFTSTNRFASGASNARNKGLGIARGKYIASLDADDEFKPQKLSKMIPLAEQYGAAISDIEFRDNESNCLLEKFNKTSNHQALSANNALWFCLNTASLYLYDRDKISNLYYENDLFRMQDLVFLMSFFNYLELIGFESEPLHIYYRREGSSCNSPNTHGVFHESKLALLRKIDGNQISIKNDSAKTKMRSLVTLFLEIDDIYDHEIRNNAMTSWNEILKDKIQSIAMSHLR